MLPDSLRRHHRILPHKMKAAANRDISQVVNEQDLLSQHHDQLVQLGNVMDEVHPRSSTSRSSPKGVNPNEGRILYHKSTQHLSPFQQSAQARDVRLSIPDKHDGTPSKCSDFLPQCSLFFAHQMGAPTTESSKVATIISLLTRRWSGLQPSGREEELGSYGSVQRSLRSSTRGQRWGFAA